MTWLEVGRRVSRAVALRLVRPKVARALAAAERRGARWMAYQQVEADKYGGRRPYGLFIWLPERRTAVTVQGSSPESAVHRWFRVHPLARTAKEALYAWEFKRSYTKTLEARQGPAATNRRGRRA